MNLQNLGILSILFFGFVSCSDNESKTETQNQVASRPTTPVLNGQVRIGTQIWMTRNLNVKRYRNGDLIPQVTDPTQWSNLTTGAWCYYENNTANGTVYGKLYNWYAVNDLRGLAPAGYHIPSEAEWITLTNFSGGENIAGSNLKGSALWSPIVGIINTNSSGFTGFPAGVRNYNGTFSSIGSYGILWGSNEVQPQDSMTFLLSCDSDITFFGYANKKSGYSVRCLRN